MRPLARLLEPSFDMQLDSYDDLQPIVAGDHAIHHYSFSWILTPKAGGQSVTERGQGIHIFRRDADGL